MEITRVFKLENLDLSIINDFAKSLAIANVVNIYIVKYSSSNTFSLILEEDLLRGFKL